MTHLLNIEGLLVLLHGLRQEGLYLIGMLGMLCLERLQKILLARILIWALLKHDHDFKLLLIEALLLEGRKGLMLLWCKALLELWIEAHREWEVLWHLWQLLRLLLGLLLGSLRGLLGS